MPIATSLSPAEFAFKSLATVILSALLLPLMAQHDTYAAESDGTYTINFPAHRVAELRVSVPSEFAPGAKTVKIAAQGKVTLPKNCDISINMCYDGLENMRSLEQIDNNQVMRFSAAKLEFNDTHLTYLKQFKHLVSLNLDDALVTDKSLPIIGTLPNLVMLRLNGTDITGSGFASLGNLRSLAYLNISGIDLKAGTLALLKPRGSHLDELICAKTGLTAADMPALAELKSLVTLDISGNKSVDNSCIKYLRPLVRLQKLNITDTAITSKSLPDLYKLPSLQLVMIRSHQFWPGGKIQKTKAGIIFQDNETTTRIPVEMFGPLH